MHIECSCNFIKKNHVCINIDCDLSVVYIQCHLYRYATELLHLKPSDPEFWAFSYDEHSLIDLPAMIDYVLN